MPLRCSSLATVERAKHKLAVPVIASLNAASAGGWVRYARILEDAGADALELNLYRVAADPFRTSTEVGQSSCAFKLETAQPFVDGPLANPGRRSSAFDGPTLAHHPVDQQDSTCGAGSGRTMDVHPVFSVVGCRPRHPQSATSNAG